jgi:hypothetical protein
MKTKNLQQTGYEIKRKFFVCFQTISIIFFSMGNKVNGQHTMDLTLGIGFPQLLNVGVRAQLKQVQIGFAIGTIPGSDKTFLTVSGDVYCHFAGHSSKSDRRLSFVKASWNYFKYENTVEKDVINSIGIAAGRDIYFSHKVGMTFDGGIGYISKENKIQKNSGTNSEVPEYSILSRLLPRLEIALFYRL